MSGNLEKEQNEQMVETVGNTLYVDGSYGLQVGTPMNFSDKRNIFKKLNDVMQEVGWVGKDGTVTVGQGYKYTSESAFIAEVRPLFVQYGLVIYPNRILSNDITVYDNNKGNKTFLTTIGMRYIIGDADSGEFIEVEVQGQGNDSGDKGVYKALTGAFKYALRQALMIGTGDDPEATDEDNQPTNRKQNRNPEPVETITVPEKRDRDPEEYKQRVRNELEGWNLEDAEVVFKKHKIKMDNLPTNSKTLRYLYEFGRELKAGKSVLDAANSLDEKMSSK